MAQSNRNKIIKCVDKCVFWERVNRLKSSIIDPQTDFYALIISVLKHLSLAAVSKKQKHYKTKKKTAFYFLLLETLMFTKKEGHIQTYKLTD